MLPWINFRHERWTDSACSLLTRFADVRAISKDVLKERYFNSKPSRGSKGCCGIASSTIDRSQDGAKGLENGGKRNITEGVSLFC